MRISIFPAANPHPKSKEEKRTEAFKFSAPHLPQSVEFEDEDGLIKLITSNCWSPFIFSGPRHADNFLLTDTLVYDIDSGLTLDEAKAIVEAKNLACLCLPSPSHSEEAHRFRIILPLSTSITDSNIYEATWDLGASIFPSCDKQTKDLARAYFGCTTEDGFWNEGDLFVPVKPLPQTKLEHAQEGKQIMLKVGADVEEIVAQIFGEKRKVVSEVVDFFIRNAHTGLPGEWTNTLNAFCFSLALSGVDECAILMVCEQLSPQPLDKKDHYQIRKAISDARKV